MSERKGTKALELWCKRLVKHCPDVHIENMTTSWRNGIAFCALVHHFRPDLIDMSTLKPENIYSNNQLAFSIAEKHLGIPSLLDPEDMVENEVPDRLSVLTYLSQFYQRLGHTVTTKVPDTDSKPSSPSATQSSAPFQFGKTGLDKCAACGLPVYLAQRLIVSHKLYHRRCFRCSKCSGHLNPKNFEFIEGSDLFCDSCKNEKTLPKFYNNNDQMGMLAFSADVTESEPNIQQEEPISPKIRPRPQSILEKISMFENKVDNETVIENRLSNIYLKDKQINKHSSFPVLVDKTSDIKIETKDEIDKPTCEKNETLLETETDVQDLSQKSYRSNKDKLNFLQTQLTSESVECESELKNDDNISSQKVDESLECESDLKNDHDISSLKVDEPNLTSNVLTEHSDLTCMPKDENSIPNIIAESTSNVTDDNRIAISNLPLDSNNLSKNEQNENISVPPRRKKNIKSPEKNTKSPEKNAKSSINTSNVSNDRIYPDHLNPFSDDEDDYKEDNNPDGKPRKKVSTNPFGSSDEEDDEVPPIHPPARLGPAPTSTPIKRLIPACNPFWSDGEEPSSEDETNEESSSMYKSSVTSSTPNLPTGARRKKPKAPLPPMVVIDSHPDQPSTSMDDVASISSFSSYNSTIHSDQKSVGKSTPSMKQKRLAPTPPDSLSLSAAGSMEHVNADTPRPAHSDGSARRVKGPAPGLPLPQRREVKLQLSSEELQTQLDMLETQQLGLERQGVLIEQMIRDKCEGDAPPDVPQEEVEDLVIQLCELVNEKNDLFRKQTELMYIRRQQRLEQEQADIEHEIRVLQSQPAVNRIDSDKAREEHLVSRLVRVVRLRDELVQQLDGERRRERREDRAIAATIAQRRAQRNSESNSSSMKSEVTTHKKSKVKDKVKKQFKKAKHSLISKKKDHSSDRKETKVEKEKKAK